MERVLPVTEARTRFLEIVKEVTDLGERFIITKRGKPEAVVISIDEIETLEILADKELMASLRRGMEDIQAGRVISSEELFGEKKE